MRESTVEAYLVRRCKQEGFYCRKWVSVNNRGVPDRIVIADGFWCGVELKAPGKRPTKLQLLEHKTIRKHGGYVYVLSNKDQVDEFIAHLIDTL
jgi:hypothetical protein